MSTATTPLIDLPRLQSLISEVDAAIDKSDGSHWTLRKELVSLEPEAGRVLRRHGWCDGICSRMKEGDGTVLGDLQQIAAEAGLAARLAVAK